ncbi:hypothetical protein U9M48_001587 [Paspalum notatum var. saurae]|uniref:Uncharacterized protein n=1 Tax=Paspalum notatum var. saurae TaxID=547442 RepID=A0AAQ3PG19_PASNO
MRRRPAAAPCLERCLHASARCQPNATARSRRKRGAPPRLAAARGPSLAGIQCLRAASPAHGPSPIGVRLTPCLRQHEQASIWKAIVSINFTKDKMHGLVMAEHIS